MAAAPFPIMLCLHLTHQTVAVPAARAPAQITTRQLIELFFSSQAGGHCKNIPTLEYGFLVQVRPPGGRMESTHTACLFRVISAVQNMTNNCVYCTRVSNNKSQPYNLFGCEGCIVLAVYSRGIVRLLVAGRDKWLGPQCIVVLAPRKQVKTAIIAVHIRNFVTILLPKTSGFIWQCCRWE